MQNTEKMQYPSLTICEGPHSARYFADGNVFQTMDLYHNWKYGTSYTPIAYHDLTEVFVQLSTAMPNMSTFSLKPSDISDRDDVSHKWCSQKSAFIVNTTHV